VDNILLRGNVTDDCGLVPNATIEFKARRGVFFYDCIGWNDEGNGWYNCTIQNTTTSTWSTGNYNVTMTASKDYYNSSGEIVKQNAFRLVTVPKLTNPTAISLGGPSIPGGWGENWNFTVDVQDEDNDDVNVSLWINLTGDWQYYDSQICINCDLGQSHTLNFGPFKFACENKGTRQFKFNATDVYNYKNETNGTFQLEKDTIQVFYGQGDGSQIDREGNDNETLSVRIRDSDNGTWVGAGVSGKIYVTTSGDTTYIGFNSTTDSQGYLYHTFNPNCTFSVGTQNWIGGTFNNTCYEDRNYTGTPFTTFVKGQLKNNLTQPTYGAEIAVGTIVSVVSDVYSDCLNEEGFLNESTVTHEAISPLYEYEGITPVTDLGNGTYNSTWNTSLHMGGNWSFRIISSRGTNYYSNTTIFINWTYLNNTAPDYSNLNVTPSIGGWGTTYNYSVNVSDIQGDDVTCTLFTSTDGGATWVKRDSGSTFGGIGLCSVNMSSFVCNQTYIDIGTDNYFFFEIDDGTNKFNTTSASGPNITEDNALIYYVFGNNSFVNRSNTNPIGNKTLLILGVNDTTKGIPASSVSVTFWVTYDNNSFGAGVANQTNSSGHASYYFNPECDIPHQVGPQKWFGGITDSCYVNSNTTNYTLTIYGDLVNDIDVVEESPSWIGDPTTVLKAERNVSIDAWLKDDCGKDLNGSTVELGLVHNDTGTKYD
jgi:hypothetical protein